MTPDEKKLEKLLALMEDPTGTLLADIEELQSKTDKTNEDVVSLAEKYSVTEQEIFALLARTVSISNFPEIQKVEITNLPRQEAPIVNVKSPIVNVTVPEIKMPDFPPFPEYPAFPEIPPTTVNVDTTTLENSLLDVLEQLKELNGTTTKNGMKEMVMQNHGYSSVNIKNNLSANINPATSENQSALLTELQLKADLTEIQPVIDTTHKQVHDGRFFSGGYYNAALADAGTIRLLIQTGATHVTHMDFAGSASGYTIVQLYEGTTFSGAGTAVTMSNHNRNSANVFPDTVTHTPTITTVGTQINGTTFVPGGVKGSGSGGDFGGFGNEFDLLPSTTYLLSVTNVSGAAEQISIHLNAYVPTL